jgi:hypothetical protein
MVLYLPSSYYESDRYISFVNDSSYIVPGSIIEVNGYKIKKPERFKNLAHERGFEIALVLAQKQPSFKYSQRMGDEYLCYTSSIIMTTSECIDVIMYNGSRAIQLKEDAVNPGVVAHDAMRFVASFFIETEVNLKTKHKLKRMWYLEIE